MATIQINLPFAQNERLHNQKAQALKAKEQQDYDAVAPYYDSYTTPLTTIFGQKSLDLLDVQPGDRVLEVACGSGVLLPAIATMVGAQGAVTGVDLSSGMLALAQRRLDQQGLSNVNLVQGDAEALINLVLAKHDRILSVFGLMYLPDPVTALKQMRALLKPGGKVVITVWGLPAATPGLTLPMVAGARVLAPRPVGWLLGRKFMRNLIHRQLLKDKPGGGKSPMCLAPAGLLEALLTKAGFSHIQRTEPSEIFVYASSDEYWDVLMGTPARMLTEQHAPAKIAKVKAMVAQMLETEYRMADGRIGMPMGAVSVSGIA